MLRFGPFRTRTEGSIATGRLSGCGYDAAFIARDTDRAMPVAEEGGGNDVMVESCCRPLSPNRFPAALCRAARPSLFFGSAVQFPRAAIEPRQHVVEPAVLLPAQRSEKV
jgi:hypothetical protein